MVARWQGFERLAEKIMLDLAPHAEVVWNDHIAGHRSEAERQIDVSVHWTDNDESYLLIVDTKDWSHPVTIDDVDKFIGLVEDVRAHRGVLVCNAGFSAQALTYAKNAGIELYNLHDAESRDWSRDLTIPIIWVERDPTVRHQAVVWFDAGDQVEKDENFPLVMSLQDDRPTDELVLPFSKVDSIGTFARMWHAGELRRDPNMSHRLHDSRPLRALVRDAAGVLRWRPVHQFELVYTVEQKSWLGQFQPSRCRGLIDHLDNQAFLASYLPISEIPLERDESWQLIDDPVQVAVTTRGTVVTAEQIRVLSADGAVYRDVSFRLLEAASSDGE